MCSAAGSDEGDPAVFAGLSKVGVLREQPVAGMHRVAAGPHRRLDHRLNVDVGLGHRRRADVRRAIRLTHVQRVGVGHRVDGVGFDPQPTAGARDARGDLAAIGDQDSLEHAGLLALNRDERIAFLHLVTLTNVHLRDRAGDRRFDRNLHLHRFEDDQLIALINAVALGDE